MAKSVASAPGDYPPGPPSAGPMDSTIEGRRMPSAPRQEDPTEQVREQWGMMLTAKQRDKLRQKDGELQGQLDQATAEGQALRARLQALGREVGEMERDVYGLREAVKMERAAVRGKERVVTVPLPFANTEPPRWALSPEALSALPQSQNGNVLPPWLWGVLALYVDVRPQALNPAPQPPPQQQQHWQQQQRQ
eukprot:comp22163_c0_seq1/m.32494 comp22163_c0_seq1/g.32494  ORF comp22163_c0_seq1/g.32494 comp22163_c0_seq1/m.32494 type:complete len:193 (-) comp22163_c0_seq1:295-873(-)